MSSAEEHRPASMFLSEARQWSLNIGIVLGDEQLQDTGPSAVEDHGQAMLKHGHPFQCKLNEIHEAPYSEITDHTLGDGEYHDEDYLEAEKELAKMLTPGTPYTESFYQHVSQQVEDDYGDEFYLATEQELATSISHRCSSSDTGHEKIQDNAGAEHMDADGGNGGFMGDEFGMHGECHQDEDTPYHDPLGGDVDHLHVSHKETRGASNEHSMARSMRSDPRNADWAGFGDSFWGIRRGGLREPVSRFFMEDIRSD